MLPNELLLQVFQHLPYHELQLKARLVCQDWKYCARDILFKRLKDTLALLHKAQTNKMNNELQLLTVPTEETTVENTSAFTCWMLGNFEHPSESQVMSALQLQLDGFDENTGLLRFLPTKLASFGMWVDHLGFISITRPYLWSKFNFSHSIKPLLKFWYPVDHKNPASKGIRQYNSDASIPTTARALSTATGKHKVALRDSFGVVGMAEYEIDNTCPTTYQEGITSDQLGGNLLQYLHEEEQKAFGQLIQVLIHPQTILSYPL